MRNFKTISHNLRKSTDRHSLGSKFPKAPARVGGKKTADKREWDLDQVSLGGRSRAGE